MRLFNEIVLENQNLRQKKKKKMKLQWWW